MLTPEDIDWSRLRGMERFHKEPEDEFAARVELAERAKSYLLSFKWCKSVVEVWWGVDAAPLFGVFMVQFEPAEWSKAEGYMWVVVGDVPSAYLWPGYARNVYQAMNGYGGEMGAWVDAVRAGEPVDKLIPVNMPPTEEFAAMLDGRLKLIDEMFIEPNEWLLEAATASERDGESEAQQ